MQAKNDLGWMHPLRHEHNHIDNKCLTQLFVCRRLCHKICRACFHQDLPSFHYRHPPPRDSFNEVRSIDKTVDVASSGMVADRLQLSRVHPTLPHLASPKPCALMTHKVYRGRRHGRFPRFQLHALGSNAAGLTCGCAGK